MQGRPPTPTVLKLAAGNPGKRPLAQGEPDPPYLEDLTPPKRLSPAAQQAWEELAPKLRAAKLLTQVDTLAFECLAEAAAEYWAARERLDAAVEAGQQIVRNSIGGAIIYHPAYTVRNRAFDRLLTLMREFGKTPASRTRIRTNPQGDMFGGNGSFEQFLREIA